MPSNGYARYPGLACEPPSRSLQKSVRVRKLLLRRANGILGGVCPGQQESAGVCVSSRSAKGNWMMRRTLSQTAWAIIVAKGSEAARRFRNGRPKIGTQKAACAVAHYQLRVVWRVLHEGVHYRQPETELLNHRAAVARAKRALTNLRKLGYIVSITPPPQPPHLRNVSGVFSSVCVCGLDGGLRRMSRGFSYATPKRTRNTQACPYRFRRVIPST